MVAFQHGLFGCLDNCGTCILALLIPCYTVGKDAESVGSSCILFGILTLTPCNIISVPMIRKKVREHQGIEGSFIGDCLLFLFCSLCVVAQMHQEVEHMSPAAIAIERD